MKDRTVHYLPEIKELPLQPLRIASGWTVTRNLFYELDPDDDLSGREILHLNRKIKDPWKDVLFYYFDRDLLWATRNHGKKLIDLTWLPPGDRNGRFVLTVQHGVEDYPETWPNRSMQVKHKGEWVLYELVTQTHYPDEGTVYETRSRAEIVELLNREMGTEQGNT